MDRGDLSAPHAAELAAALQDQDSHGPYKGLGFRGNIRGYIGIMKKKTETTI